MYRGQTTKADERGSPEELVELPSNGSHKPLRLTLASTLLVTVT